MQLRLNDVKVNEIPKFLTDKPDDDSHALAMPREEEDDYVIPLSLDGVTSYFDTWKPTKEQYEEAEIKLDLTYELPDWDPTTDSFAEQEAAMTDSAGGVREIGDGDRGQVSEISQSHASMLKS